MKKLLVILGLVLIVGGTWGLFYTYTNVVAQKIVTPEDASIPGVPVRGPLTLKAQADIIRTHMLKMTEGKTYAEMERTDPNRNTWITATTLITALNLAILAYALSALALINGLAFVLLGL